MVRVQCDLKREQIWHRHLKEYHSSGQTIRAYCHANDLRETAFYFWRKEIAYRDREQAAPSPTPSTAPSSPAFVPVTVIESPTKGNETRIDIWLAGGHRVRVRTGCDRDLLADAMAMLQRFATEGRSC